MNVASSTVFSEKCCSFERLKLFGFSRVKTCKGLDVLALLRWKSDEKIEVISTSGQEIFSYNKNIEIMCFCHFLQFFSLEIKLIAV
jgi:hypothetical protein